VIFGAGMIHQPRTLSTIVPFIQQSKKNSTGGTGGKGLFDS
jgi:hypothetical protein